MQPVVKIRRAVGAVITWGDSFLLVHKVKMMEGRAGPEDVPGMWDFPKGGVKPGDADLPTALLRELAEETGSTRYRILAEYPGKVRFDFLPADQFKLGFKSQETTFFRVIYEGDGSDLQPQDEEIDALRFVPSAEVLETLFHAEMRRFFSESVLDRG
jgi:putative (di)nucleoside polyphosphate hydrolase